MGVRSEPARLTEKPPGCAGSLKHIAFVAAIVASLKGDFGQGRVGVSSTSAPRMIAKPSWPFCPFFDLDLLESALPCAS